jgi:hypothetical protein
MQSPNLEYLLHSIPMQQVLPGGRVPEGGLGLNPTSTHQKLNQNESASEESCERDVEFQCDIAGMHA